MYGVMCGLVKCFGIELLGECSGYGKLMCGVCVMGLVCGGWCYVVVVV